MMPRAESEPAPEKATAEPKPEKEPPRGEPGPNWELAKTLSGWPSVWDCHWIGTAVLFALLSIFALYCLRRLYKRKRKQHIMVKFSVMVTATIAVFTFTRFLYLILNPYESPLFCLFGKEKCPPFINRTLFSLGMPSLVSAYALLFLALNKVVQMKVMGKFNKLQSWCFLGVFIITNYAFSCSADLTVWYITSARLFLALCQGYFILLSACLVCAYLYVGIRIYRTNRNTKSQIARLSMKGRKEIGSPQGQNSVKKVVRLAMVTATLGAVLLALEIFALTYVYAKTFSTGHIEPWPWLAYEYVYRLVELVLAASILYNISFMPNRKSLRKELGLSIPQSTLKTSQRATVISGGKYEVNGPIVKSSDIKLQESIDRSKCD